jgi:hypothetical protein
MMGYSLHGLVGAGIGLTLANVFDFVAINWVYRIRYSYKVQLTTLSHMLVQFFLLGAVLAICFTCEGWLKYACGAPVLMLSCFVSLCVYRRQRR